MADNLEKEKMQEEKLSYVESIFEKYGAKAIDINEKNREKFGERKIYLLGDNYYRAGKLMADDQGESYMVISSIDNEKYASVGMLEDVEAIPFSASNEDIEKQMRYLLGIEPYPEDYYT